MEHLPDPIQRKVCEYLIPYSVHRLSCTSRDMLRAFKRFVVHSFKCRMDKLIVDICQFPGLFDKLKSFFPSLRLDVVNHLFKHESHAHLIEYHSWSCFSVSEQEYPQDVTRIAAFQKEFPSFRIANQTIIGLPSTCLMAARIWINCGQNPYFSHYNGSELCLCKE